MVADINNPKPLYEGSLMEFDEWANYVEGAWYDSLSKGLGRDGARAAMGATKPMFAVAAGQAYDEYVAGWKRHHRARRKAV